MSKIFYSDKLEIFYFKNYRYFVEATKEGE
jgi:hypothetical protein